MSVEVEGKAREWTERRLVVRLVRHAEAAEVANALKMSRPYARRRTRLSSVTASKNSCGFATIITPRRTRCEHIRIGRRL